MKSDDETDEDQQPPPCPWCHAAGVREITAGSGDTRWLFCESCKRVFSIRCELLKRAREEGLAHCHDAVDQRG